MIPQPNKFYKNPYFKGLFVKVDKLLERQINRTLVQGTWYRFDDDTRKVISMNEEQEIWLDNDWQEVKI